MHANSCRLILWKWENLHLVSFHPMTFSKIIFQVIFFPVSPLLLQRIAVIVKEVIYENIFLSSRIYSSELSCLSLTWQQSAFGHGQCKQWDNADTDRNIPAPLLNFGLFLRYAINHTATLIWLISVGKIRIHAYRHEEERTDSLHHFYSTLVEIIWLQTLLIAAASAWNLTLLTGSFLSHAEWGWRCEMCTSTLYSYSSRSFLLEPGPFFSYSLAWGMFIAHNYCQ